MKQVMIRYRVKSDRADENEALVRAVYEELHRTRPAGLRYATLQLPDRVSFVHLAATEDGREPLRAIQAFARFREGLDDRCDEAPVATELRLIGSFGLFGDEDDGQPGTAT